MKTIRWAVALMALATAGCATTSDSTRAGLECGVGIGILGGAICEVATHGHDNGKCAAVTAISGAGAGLACSSYAKHLEARSHELQGKENDLNAQIHYVQELNADTEKLNSQLAERVSALTSDTDRVVAQVNQLSAQQLQAERQKRTDLLNVSQEEVTKGKQALQNARQLRSHDRGDSSALDAAIAQQEVLLQQAQRQVDLLAEQRARV